MFIGAFKIYKTTIYENSRNVNDKPFRQIKEGLKTIEVRLKDEKRSLLKEEDIILFTNRSDDQDHCKTKIINLIYTESFQKLPEICPIEKAGWEKGTSGEQVEKDMRKYYSKEDEKKYGVVGIELEVF